MDKEEMFREENTILQSTLQSLKKSNAKLELLKQSYHEEGLAQQEYYWNTRMDENEKLAAKAQYDETVNDFLQVLKEVYKNEKMQKSPYYGRIDFIDDDQDTPSSLYIGLFGYNEKDAPFILDWRTPVASIFYDYEVGDVTYKVGDETFKGYLQGKRQLKIEDGTLKYVINSSLKIDDEILQQALSHNTSAKMQNVVATIQKEQNQIIRLPYNTNVIVQGVAGSGKTSVALHRVAFLMYRNKDVLNYKNILILSPNKVFEDYISTVLPELGEENINSISFDKILNDYFYKIEEKVETKAAQYERLLASNVLSPEVSYKQSAEIIDDLKKYLEKNTHKMFNPKDIALGSFFIPQQKIIEIYNKDKTLPHHERISNIRKYVKIEYLKFKDYDEQSLTGAINSKIKSMTPKNANNMLARDFLKQYKFNLTRVEEDKIKYEDAFILMYIDDYLYGLVPDTQISHLVIDEMQDYSPLQFYILNKLYPCSKTLLGDWGQAPDMYTAKNSITYLPKLFDNSLFLTMNKCYRSGAEIGKLCNSISKRDDVTLVRTTGDKPVIAKVDTMEELLNQLDYIMTMCNQLGYKNVAIITKNQKEANYYYKKIHEVMHCHLITSNTVELENGLVIAPSFQSKGLEFDCVIIPDACDDNYKSSIEQQNLYVACTRALHKLFIFYSGEMTRYLKGYVSDK